ncbi:MAG: nitronate monooxygenase [Bacteroidales bacterium]|nr:nitronate monooxygenase [Bacteroidales bacterium]
MNTIINLFNIKYPIIQGGMIWCSGWRLASAVSNGGGLGLIGSGSMNPDLLQEHIQKCKKATDKPFGVNIPLMFSHSEDFIKICIQEKVSAVFTSAGNPVKWTAILKDNGIRVAHVVANTKGAIKCTEAGVDAIVVEGFEAGGHNGKEETTTLVLVPHVKLVTHLPLIAAGGIGTGRGMLAAMALGARGVQIGSRFAASVESSAHPNFKQKIVEAVEGDTLLSLKKLIGVRLLKNDFFQKVFESETNGANKEELSMLLGRGRAQKGMFEGDIYEGELEIGQISALINEIKPAAQIIDEIINEYFAAKKDLCNKNF